LIRFINGYLLFPLLDKFSQRRVFEKYRELKAFEKLSVDEQRTFQREELYKCLLFCKEHIPYYQNIFQQQRFDIELIRKDIRYIEALPALTKQIVRDNTDRLKFHSGVHACKTGGSTGQSVYFYYDNEGRDWSSAINLMAYHMAKNYLHRKDCHISSEIGVEPKELKWKFLDWLKLFAQNRKRLMIRSFSDDDLLRNYKKLKRLKPYLMQGHPSSAYAIAEYISRNNLPKRTYCSIFEPSGEMLTEKIVRSIETNLGAKVVNRYGNAEFGVVAHSRFEDPYTKLKVFDRAFYVEDCEKDNLIVTAFTNHGMPLLRYDTGDMGTVKTESDGTFIYDIQGRVHDTVLIEKEEYATHYIMDFLDHKVKHVREFQILLRDDISPLLRIVPENPDDTDRIRKAVYQRWPTGVDIEFINFDELEKVGWRQKFRHVLDRRSEAA
jgi:phenylacetate-CoA ligase